MARLQALLIAAAAVSVASYTRVAKLVAEDATGSLFGRQGFVSGNGAYIVVGGFDVDAYGAAYVFRVANDGTTWTQVAKVVSDVERTDNVTFDSFGAGAGIAMSGDRLVVASPADDLNPGFVYLFRRREGFENPGDGETWDRVAKFSSSEDGDTFGGLREGSRGSGRGVALDGDVFVVGAQTKDSGVVKEVGAAMVFRAEGDTWSRVASLVPEDLRYPYAAFGCSVAISGDVIVVGAYGDTTGSHRSGAAYVYRTADEGATWAQVARLTGAAQAVSGAAQEGSPDDGGLVVGVGILEEEFGSSVAIGGGTIVVGAPAAECSFDQDDVIVGAAYVYTFEGTGVPTLIAKLCPDNRENSRQFGKSVAVNDDGVVVVNSETSSVDGTSEGPIYVFDGLGAAFDGDVAYQKLPVGLGDFVSISGDTIVVGSSDEDDYKGAVYVFKSGVPPTEAPTVGAAPATELPTEAPVAAPVVAESDAAVSKQATTLAVAAFAVALAAL